MWYRLQDLIDRYQRADHRINLARSRALIAEETAAAAKREADQLREDMRVRQAGVMRLRDEIASRERTIERLKRTLNSSYGKTANYNPPPTHARPPMPAGPKSRGFPFLTPAFLPCEMSGHPKGWHRFNIDAHGGGFCTYCNAAYHPSSTYQQPKEPMNTPTPRETANLSSIEIADLVKSIQEERAKEYGQAGGERSMPAMVAAFNAITGKDISESEGWMFMVLLKMVRDRAGKPHKDSCVDMASYATLYGESRLKETPTIKIDRELFDTSATRNETLFADTMAIMGRFKTTHGRDAATTLISFISNGKHVKMAPLTDEELKRLFELAKLILDLPF